MNESEASGTGANAEHARLIVLATTDLHFQLWPFDLLSDRPMPGHGLGLLSERIAALRQTSPNTLLLDNGDFLQGNPHADWVAAQRGFAEADPHPLIGVMNRLGYDGATLGNHDLNYGLEYLQAALSEARFPFVSANINLPTRWNGPGLAPFRILERRIRTVQGTDRILRVGLIGFAPPKAARWDRHPNDTGILTSDILEAAKAYLPAIREAGADLVVALCHSGIGQGAHRPEAENAANHLAALDGIDLVIAGHTHHVFPSAHAPSGPGVDKIGGFFHGKPAVMPGGFGSHLGVIELDLDWSDDTLAIRTHSVRAEPLPPVKLISKSAADRLDPARTSYDDMVRHIREPIGATSTPLHSLLIAAGIDPVGRLVGDALIRHARTLLQPGGTDYPLLAATANFRTGGRDGSGPYTDIAPGTLTRRHAAEFYPFPNYVKVIEVSGAVLKNWLEFSARVFRTIEDGNRDQPLLDPDVPLYNFDMLWGLTYVIDLRAPPGQGRIGDLMCGDRQVTDDDRFAVATNTFRASGGGGYDMLASVPTLAQSRETIQVAIADHIIASSPVRVDGTAAWRFAPIADTAAWFPAHRDALRHISESGHLSYCAPDGDRSASQGATMPFRLTVSF